MKALNFDYDMNTSYEVKSELVLLAGMSVDGICDRYTLDPDDVEGFMGLMEEDYETLLEEEDERGYVNDRNEEYAQFYNFL